MATLPPGVMFVEPQNTPLSATAGLLPLATRVFSLTGTLTAATIYTDGALTVPFTPSANIAVADGNGRFPPIYMDPSIVYRSQLFTAAAALLEDVDPYIPAPFSLKAAFKPAPTDRTAATTPIDPDLQIAIVPPLTQATYEYEALLEFTTTGASGAAPGLDLGMSFSGTLVTGFAVSYSIEGYLDGVSANAGQINSPSAFSLQTTPALNAVFIHGVFTCSTGGTLAVAWGTATNTGVAVELAAGSVLTARRIA
jgi:hypothetical protein